ncbi:TonB-dependent receptor [Myroides odoratus]|uniref:Outer membrane receptor for Fe3+-dicitrate n=1 Tax=Myroides odoratus TaxID=256 RepID=A0A378RMW0_MYROD|nr:TonB-dependent receptor [Myroides odoratus]QQU04923.1 TonB-dependent receptor [Myroides odoratus]STZ27611.1 Outer membrane receptor for Fe3+-dicitrate [Myroides odoratus]
MFNLSPCYFVFLLIPCLSYGQSFQLQGQVVNSKQQPVEFMDVYLTSSTNSNTPHAYTDSLGNFTLQVLRGNYTLLLIEFGKQKYSQDLVVAQDMNLGKIQVDEGVVLDSITITAKKKLIERKVDRLVFNVENSVSASGGDALDALKVTPSVQVKNDKIAVAWKSNVSILVDDKYIILAGDELTQFLKSIASDNIERIEVMTTPPSKYSAEGDGGLINIKLKKSALHSWSNTSRTAYTQATYPSTSFGNTFNYQKDKVSLLIDASMRQNKTIYTNEIHYYYPQEHWKSDLYDQMKNLGFSSMFNLGYALNNKQKISFQYIGSTATPKTKEDGLTAIYKKENQHLSRTLSSKSNAENNYDNHAFTTALVTKLDTLGKKYTLDVDYFLYSSTKKNKQITEMIQEVNPLTTTTVLNNNAQYINNLASQIDFELPYTWATLEFGGKISFTKISSKIDIETVEQQKAQHQQEDHFSYRENTQALYFSSAKSWGEKWQIKAGLRAESTQNEGSSSSVNQTNKKKYMELFPTLYVANKLNDKHDITLRYGKRIQRPSYANLNPARWYLSSTSYEEGNPFLQPSFTTTLELSHSFKNKLFTTVSFSQVKNGFGQLTTHNEEYNFQKFTQLNYYSLHSINYNMYASTDILSWWTNTFEFNTFYAESKTNTTYLNPKYSGWGAYFIATTTLTLNKANTVIAEISYEQNFDSNYIGNKAGANANVTAGIKLSLLDKKLQCVLNANNILGTDRMLLSNTTQNVFQTFKQYYDTQYVRFSMSYSFGNKNIAVKKQNSSNEEEKGRAN